MYICKIKQKNMDMNNENVVAPTRKPRLFRWALWWGLGIIVTSLAALVVYAITNPSAVEGMNAPLMKTVYSLISRFGIWPVILYMGNHIFIDPADDITAHFIKGIIVEYTKKLCQQIIREYSVVFGKNTDQLFRLCFNQFHGMVNDLA